MRRRRPTLGPAAAPGTPTTSSSPTRPPTPRPRSPRPAPARSAACRPLYALAAGAGVVAPLPGRALPVDSVAGVALGRRRRRAAAEGRHRRAAQRGQVVAVQRAHPGRRGGGQLPVHDDRAERRDRRRCPTSGSSGWPRRVGATPVVPRDDRVPRHRRARRAARTQGEGLGNQFLAQHPRDRRDRATSCARTTTPASSTRRGEVDPLADIETIETELLYADLEQAERRLERVEPSRPRRGDKERGRRGGWLRDVVDALREGRPVRTVPVPDAAAGALRAPLGADRRSRCSTWRTSTRASRTSRRRRWSSTPRARGAARDRRQRSRSRRSSPSCADDEAAAMREELGVAESGLRPGDPRRVRAAAPDLVLHRRTRTRRRDAWRHARAARRAWRGRRGDPHRHPARLRGGRGDRPGRTLVECGGYAAAREQALTRVEGRDYVMRDGDVVTFRFTP